VLEFERARFRDGEFHRVPSPGMTMPGQGGDGSSNLLNMRSNEDIHSGPHYLDKPVFDLKACPMIG